MRWISLEIKEVTGGDAAESAPRCFCWSDTVLVSFEESKEDEDDVEEDKLEEEESELEEEESELEGEESELEEEESELEDEELEVDDDGVDETRGRVCSSSVLVP